MDQANAIESSPVRPLPQKRPASQAEEVNFAGHTLTVSTDSSASQRPAPDSARQDSSRKEYGPDPARHPSSRWPDLVLEQIFRALNIGDLMACSQVCLDWQRVASAPRLQRHCFLQTYTQAHRKAMERALNGLVHASLPPWCDSPQAWPEPEPPLQQLLCTMIGQMLLKPHFSAAVFNETPALAGCTKELLCSPDGRLIAWARDFVSCEREGNNKVNLWNPWKYTGVLSNSAPAIAEPGDEVEQLTFNSDASRLRILYKSGLVIVLQPYPQHRDCFFGVEGQPFLGDWRHRTVPSPDGQHLGVSTVNEVFIFGAGRHSDWNYTPEWMRYWSDQCPFSPVRHPCEVSMRFSDDSCHFAFAFENRAVVATREAARWREQTIDLPGPIKGRPFFDAHSRLLALAYGSHNAGEGPSIAVNILFWHLAHKPGCPPAWEPARELGPLQRSGLGARIHLPACDRSSRPDCPKGREQPEAARCPLKRRHYYARIHLPADDSLPMASSPDGQLLALPYWQDCQTAFVVPVSGPQAWTTGVPLRWGQEQHEQGNDLLWSLQFSASSDYLAVHTHRGRYLRLWRRCCHSWNRVLEIDGTTQPELPFAFSPDGFHCVTGIRSDNRDNVCLWGPVSGGDYGCKGSTTLPRDARVDKLLFTPDATRVLIAMSYQQEQQTAEQETPSTVSRLLSWRLFPHTATGLTLHTTAPMCLHRAFPAQASPPPVSEPTQDLWPSLPAPG